MSNEKELVKCMLDMQDTFNSKLDINWRYCNWNWKACIIAEAGELIESCDYKHWKHTTPDYDNIKVEAIDLLHFLMSKLLQDKSSFSTHSIILQSYEMSIDYETYYNEDIICDNAIKMIEETERAFIYLFNIFNQLEMSLEDVYKAYIVKNTLNAFRQKNGYKEGTYIKEWIVDLNPNVQVIDYDYDDTVREDNVVAYILADKLECNTELFDNLYSELDRVYNSMLKD